MFQSKLQKKTLNEFKQAWIETSYLIGLQILANSGFAVPELIVASTE